MNKTILVGLAALAMAVGAGHAQNIYNPYLVGTLRDFRASTSPDGHPDFEPGDPGGVVANAVTGELGVDGLPVFNNPASMHYHGAAAFNQWYRDTPGVNLSKPFRAELAHACAGVTTFIFRRDRFFPLDEQLFGNEGRAHNYHFTCELHAEFTTTGAAFINLTSDDDAWIFVNGKRVIDLGGVHPPASANTNLDAAALGLLPGSTTNRLDVFFAERHTTDSVLIIETNLRLHAPGAPEPPLLPLERVEWTAGNGNWENPANWTPARVPGTHDWAVICNGATVQLNASANVGGLSLGNGTVTHARGNINGANITAATIIEVLSGGRIDVTGSGYLGGNNPGNTIPGTDFEQPGQTRGEGGVPVSGATINSGGSYGSLGGGVRPNPLYGSETAPVDLGSGGASSFPDFGGAGGGRMELQAESLMVDGALLANGGFSYGGDGLLASRGGGSGGSIYVLLVGGTFAGTGVIEAKGGNSLGSGIGGGGRISISGHSYTNFIGSLGSLPRLNSTKDSGGIVPVNFTGIITGGSVYVNARPLPPAQGDRVINELTLLAVTNAATDLDLTNQLAYALLAAPAGATISAHGVIEWFPSESDGPSTNLFTTVVTDNASVPLSATNTFAVVVNEVNVAPVLTVTSNRTVNPGQTISFTATATDADLPANLLSFSLINSPGSATIGSSNGVFNWRPGVALANTTNVVQVRVQDDGVPSLADTESFTVIVNALAPVVLTVTINDEADFTATVSGGANGLDYIVQASTNLTQWTDVRTNLSATPPFEFMDSESGSFPHRFFRVRLQP